MAKLKWDEVGKRLYETGVEQGVVFPWDKENEAYGTGVAWNGLTAATESRSGAEATKIYADDINYLTMYSVEEFGGTIEAYTYPDEFAECDGSAFGSFTTSGASPTTTAIPGLTVGQQPRKAFGFAFKSKIGNDTEDNDHGYKLHLWYGCKAAPSERAYATINDSPEAMTLSWEVTCTPVEIPGFKPSAILTIDSTKFGSDAGQLPTANLTALENVLFGTDGTPGTDPRLPLPSEVMQILATGTVPVG